MTVALSFQNLLYALIGCMVGTLIGVLPGIYYGAQYGGSTTSILVNLPGEASSVVTCIDGYQMARKGRAGAALSISAVGSFFAGTVGTIIIVIFAEPLTRMAQKFGPADYCSLMALGLVAAVVLASGSVLKAIAMVFLGVLFGGGPTLGAFSAYTLEKKLSKRPEEFGKGAVEGVASPEAANNAAAQTSFIPMLTLGIPSNAVMALMV